MRAVVMARHGGPGVLRVADVPDPAVGRDEVIIDVHAASVNADDWRVRAGAGPYAGMTLPHVLGRDFSGVVSAVGPDADLKIGQEVFGVNLPGRDGGYAERIAVGSAIVARKPAELDHAESAAIALTGITAIHGLEDAAHLRPGHEVLVQGGAGGVGSFAIQLAKHLGAVVTTTASARNTAYVKALGADNVIDYNREDLPVGERFDVVYDTVGGEVQRRSAVVVKPGGMLVVCAPGHEDVFPNREDITVTRPVVARDRAHLDRVSDLVRIGAIRPPTITRFSLAEAAEAHRISESRHFQGKLVLEVR